MSSSSFVSMSGLLLVTALVGCDRSGADKLPAVNPDFPAVVELGELEVITRAQLEEMRAENPRTKQWCDNSASEPRLQVGDRQQAADTPLCHYGQLGVASIGEYGGATFTFQGTGGNVCIVVDPETVFWSEARSRENPRQEYSYPDLEEDDGDLDLFAGLSAYYTGSPGIELGNFRGFYTDSLGNQTEIEYGLCSKLGANNTIAHAGRGTVDFCTVDTSNAAGIEHTVVLETFAVPLDDGVLSYGVMVLNGACQAIDECTLLSESLTPDVNDPQPRECTPNLEQAFCERAGLGAFCCIHPEMCGEDAVVDECREVFDEYDVNNLDELTEVYCQESGLCCNQ